MDPDVCLQDMLELAREILADEHAYEGPAQLASLVEALDGWLRKGRFMPARWER